LINYHHNKKEFGK